jgi:hypothetical protein
LDEDRNLSELGDRAKVIASLFSRNAKIDRSVFVRDAEHAKGKLHLVRVT